LAVGSFASPAGQDGSARTACSMAVRNLDLMGLGPRIVAQILLQH